MIHENQVGFIKGRFIGENTRQLYDIMHHLEERNSKGLLLLVDFEKAFDSISWKFIDKVLSFLNFGMIFRNYIKCLNNDFKLCVIQHGFFSSFLCPPLKKEGHIALHMSVGMSVGRSVGRYVGMSVGMSVALNLVQLITQEGFALEASNLVGR